jgi:hypothetical protein
MAIEASETLDVFFKIKKTVIDTALESAVKNLDEHLRREKAYQVLRDRLG